MNRRRFLGVLGKLLIQTSAIPLLGHAMKSKIEFDPKTELQPIFRQIVMEYEVTDFMIERIPNG